MLGSNKINTKSIKQFKDLKRLYVVKHNLITWRQAPVKDQIMQESVILRV